MCRIADRFRFPETSAVARLRAALAGDRVWPDAAEREAAAEIERRWPGTAQIMRRALGFHRLAAAAAVSGEEPVTGVIFGGAGLPVAPHPHEDAAAAAPGTWFAYASADPGTAAYNRVKVGGPRVHAVSVPLWRPGELLAASFAAAGAPDDAPVMLQVQLCAQFWDGETARAIAGEYACLLPPGSLLAMSVQVPGAGDAECGPLIESVTGWRVHSHAPEDVAGWLESAGCRILPPGVRDVRAWGRPGLTEAEYARRPAGRIVGVVARVPRRRAGAGGGRRRSGPA